MVFPNFEGKHDEDSIVEPNEFLAYMKSINKDPYSKNPNFKCPETIIFCFNRSVIKKLIVDHNVTKVDVFAGATYVFNDSDGKLAVVGGFGIGAPMVITIMEEFIALGVKNFIVVGTAGSLQKNISVGSTLICEKSIRDEGTSHHYLSPEKYAYADSDLSNKLFDYLKENGVDVLRGSSWTIDAPYRETVKEAKEYQKEGVSAVEMEASAIFSVAKYRNVFAAAVLIVSDTLAELEWKPDFYGDDVSKNLYLAFNLVIDLFS